MTSKDLHGELARWSLKLQMFNMIVDHRKGKLHRNVDALTLAELGLVQMLNFAAEDTYEQEAEWESDESDNSSCSSCSEDSMSEDQGLEFLRERDQFVNAELARIAALPADETSVSDGPVRPVCFALSWTLSEEDEGDDPMETALDEWFDEERREEMELIYSPLEVQALLDLMEEAQELDQDDGSAEPQELGDRTLVDDPVGREVEEPLPEQLQNWLAALQTPAQDEGHPRCGRCQAKNLSMISRRKLEMSLGFSGYL